MEYKEILERFGLSDITEVMPVSGGHINKTWLVECHDGEKYILQTLSGEVFKAPEAVMSNIARICRIFGNSQEKRVTVPRYLSTDEGKLLAEYEGELFRVYEYSESLRSAESPYASGFAVGAFIRILSQGNIRLESTIVDFHSYSCYFSALVAADKTSGLKKIDNSVMRRLSSLEETLRQVFTVDFPKRNVHNDAKRDNIVFGETLTVIDLDTVMPGYAAIDYGDLIRSSCTSGNINLAVVRDITRGFAEGLEGILSDDEIYSLYYGILYVTGELAVRYLIDYLSEEKYFKGKTTAQCLSRANELLEVLSLFISHGEDITEIIYKAFKKQ